jgi:hypothetical protein
MYTLIGSAKINGVDLELYLRTSLARIVASAGNDFLIIPSR